MPFQSELLAYAMLGVPIWLVYLLSRKRTEARHRSIQRDAQEAGLVEPNTLHPVIDTSRCIGCAACVQACPEGDVIGLLSGKATLIDPTRCIGHGACQKACPVGAIELMFGTATRGVDIPTVSADFETNVPGIYLAGEIGGMGLIRNAINQGVQAVDAIAKSLTNDHVRGIEVLDLLIVGAGPAGIAASLAATERGLRFETIEQNSIGGTVAHYPRHKVVMTEPAVLPLYGEVRDRVLSKEDLLGLWHEVIAKTGMVIRCNEQVLEIASVPDGFRIETSTGTFLARRVLLAIGRRGTPRQLEVPGEELPKVVYRLVDPTQYRGRKVLVVGGGDTALEAATTLAEEPGVEVSLAYRSATFSRARKENRQRIEELAATNALKLYLNANVSTIFSEGVGLVVGSRHLALENDDVIVCAGGVLPSGFLANLGIKMERHFGPDRMPEIIQHAA